MPRAEQTTVQAHNHAEWDRLGLKDFGDYAESVEYRNERESGYGDDEGDWLYADDDTLTLYSGTHGNDHSPGATHYTMATVYADPAEYARDRDEFLAQPERIDDDWEEESEED